jgi:putative endopeptidase
MRLATAGKPDPKTDGLTRDQRFFLSFATTWRQQRTPEFTKVLANTDPHSPARFRANGTVANLPAFAAAFACKADQPMARGEKRVAIW